MDNETIRRVLRLSDSEYKSMVEYQKKAEVATVLWCEEHCLEFFDFEKECSECVRDKLEFAEDIWIKSEYKRKKEAKVR
jgi:hypothetical protein